MVAWRLGLYLVDVQDSTSELIHWKVVQLLS